VTIQQRQFIKWYNTSTPSYPVAMKQQAHGIELVQEIGSRHTTVITQDTRETVFLFQRLSIVLQRGNAVFFLNTMNSRSRCSR